MEAFLYASCFAVFDSHVSQIWQSKNFKSDLISKSTLTKKKVSLQTGELSLEGGRGAHQNCVKRIIILMKKTYRTTYSREKPASDRGKCAKGGGYVTG